MRRTIAAAALLVACTPLTAIASAHAETASWSDPSGDISDAQLDLTDVRVTNNDGGVLVRLTVSNLDPNTYGGTSVYIDTNKRRPGPEFQVAGGTGAETDWNIFRMRGWTQSLGDGPINCNTNMDVNYQRGFVRWYVNSGCLGDYSKVRVAATATLSKTDWAPKRRTFYKVLTRG